MSNEYTFKLSPISDAFVKRIMVVEDQSRHTAINNLILLAIQSHPASSLWLSQYVKDAEEAHIIINGHCDGVAEELLSHE